MTQPATGAVARRPSQWETIVRDVEPEFTVLANAIGNVVNFQREAGFAIDLLNASDFLRKCTTESIRTAVKNIAAIGITLNPALKLAYLVPREGKCCLDISAQGFIKLATDSGSVLTAKALVVRKNDTFVYHGPFEQPEHIFDPFATHAQRGAIIGAYSLAKLHDGTFICDTLNLEEINKIRSVSKAKSGPWQQWEEEMMKKTALKRGYKSWPKTERLSQAEAVLNEHEGMDFGPAGGSKSGGAELAQQAMAAQVQDTDERSTLLGQLERAVANGVAAYQKAWGELTAHQRKLIGLDTHNGLKARAADADAGVSEVTYTEHPQAGAA